MSKHRGQPEPWCVCGQIVCDHVKPGPHVTLAAAAGRTDAMPGVFIVELEVKHVASGRLETFRRVVTGQTILEALSLAMDDVDTQFMVAVCGHVQYLGLVKDVVVNEYRVSIMEGETDGKSDSE